MGYHANMHPISMQVAYSSVTVASRIQEASKSSKLFTLFLCWAVKAYR